MGQPRAITADDVLLREGLASGGRVGDLLKSRVGDVEELLDTLGRIARGGSVVDPRW